MDEGLLYTYEMSPIDWWVGWNKLYRDKDGTALIQWAQLGGMWDDIITGEEEAEPAQLDFGRRANDAEYAVRAVTSWEGDGSWRWAPLPYPDANNSVWMFAVKQSNNGTTYLASPVPLSYLDRRVDDLRQPHPQGAV